ncbi:hypothetical protein [Hydrogenophaga sp. MI9]|uniref:hypothetical protein n=1 Tax=Hydrogenophaga sp. MI9 TaxID=3453719 RepID=UPI003EEC7A68
MPHSIPEHLHHLFDGYDGGKEPPDGQIEALIAAAPQEFRDRLVERQKELHWVFIENEGALFRGPSRGNPIEVWSVGHGKFVDYPARDLLRGVDWGTVITSEQARSLMSQS